MAKPWKIPYLNPNENLKICLRKILRTRNREMFSYEKGTIEGADFEALHNMRVSSRRLQAVLKISRPCFPQKKFRAHDKRVKTLIRSLGQVRDYDVRIDMLYKFEQTLPPDDRKAIDLLIARQMNLRTDERLRLTKILKLLRDDRFEEKFLEFVSKLL